MEQYSTTTPSQFGDSGNTDVILGLIQPSHTQIDFISGMGAKPPEQTGPSYFNSSIEINAGQRQLSRRSDLFRVRLGA